ncbi:hypothetical protein [Staphylococcus phage vB_SsapH-Golestan-100]|nr:hypothetical protein [Staphylococcus phage vB_SsapH-Golestan-100]
MAKNNQQNTTVSTEDLKTWLTYLATKSVEGKEEPTEMDLKRLERISKKSITLNNATTVAKLMSDLETQDLRSQLDLLQQSFSVLAYVVQHKLEITDSEFQQYVSDYEKDLEKYKEDMVEQAKKEQEAKAKDDKVVSMDAGVEDGKQ